MKLELTSLDGRGTRARLRRAIFQLQVQRERLADQVGQEAIRVGHSLERAVRATATGHINSLGEIQGACGHIDALMGAVRMCDEVLELMRDVYNVENA